MRFALLIIVCSVLYSCGESIKEEDLNFLSGYWEIEKVEFPDGNSKTYSINTTIDYFEYGNKKGFRKKVQPRLDGTFRTSDDAESFNIVAKNNKFTVVYQNDLSRWEEDILTLTDKSLVLASQEGVVYHYKKFEGILELQDGKEK